MMKKVKEPFLACWWQWFLSLGLMGEINGKSHDSSLQQVSIGCSVGAYLTEGVWSTGFSQAANITGNVHTGMATGGVATAGLPTTNPISYFGL
jgi:hypothetical protein